VNLETIEYARGYARELNASGNVVRHLTRISYARLYLDAHYPPRKTIDCAAIRFADVPDALPEKSDYRYALAFPAGVEAGNAIYLFAPTGNNLVPYYVQCGIGTRRLILDRVTVLMVPPLPSSKALHVSTGKTLMREPVKVSSGYQGHCEIIGANVFTEHASTNGDICEYSGTLAGARMRPKEACPKCGHTDTIDLDYTGTWTPDTDQSARILREAGVAWW
jgi:hypothetical protein